MKVHCSKILARLLFLIVLMLSTDCRAQNNELNDSLMKVVIAKQTSINQKKLSMPGFRVQIYVGGKRDKASEIKASFNSNFPNIPAYIAYQQPNFKVRVGDCKTRLEALYLLEQIKANYEVAFVVRDEVKLPEIK
jgi:hypothetical protein